MDDDKPSVWASTIKVVLAVIVLVGAVGLALWYANQSPRSSPAMEQAIEEARRQTGNTPSKDPSGWGILHDSPLRKRN